MLDLQKADLKMISIIKFESHDQNLLIKANLKKIKERLKESQIMYQNVIFLWQQRDSNTQLLSAETCL